MHALTLLAIPTTKADRTLFGKRGEKPHGHKNMGSTILQGFLSQRPGMMSSEAHIAR
jgi:hypothetical protein